jgi:flagellar hook-associated protein 3 FlgL
MAVNGLGDLAWNLLTRRQSAELKALTRRLGTEVSTGLAADPARALGGDVAPLASIETVLARLTSFARTAAETGDLAARQQAALASLGDMTADLTPRLLDPVSNATPAALSAVTREAAARLEAAVATLNAPFAGRSVFAGTASDGPALAPAETMLTALETEIAGLTTAADVAAAVTAWFADPAGFGTIGYLGGAPVAPVVLSDRDSVALDATAADPALRDTLAGLATAALLARGSGPAAPAERQALALRAGEVLLAAETARATLSGRIGTAEARIAAVAGEGASERAALELTRTQMLAVDPYEAASRLEAASNQLEALYAVTARLSRLSLLEFLR